MADLQQVLRKTSLTVTETFRMDGAPIDIDSGLPTLAITKPDGTAYTPLPTVSGSWSGRTTGQYRFVLPRQLECTWLDYELTGNIGGEPQTLGGRVEWVGALLFTLADLRAVKVGNSGTPFADTAAYPNELLQNIRTEVTDDFAHRCGWSFVPHFVRETKDGDGRSSLVLDELKARHPPLSVTVNGVAQQVGNYSLKRSGILQATSNYTLSGTFTDGVQNVVVEYIAGWERSPAAVSRAALARAAMLLLPSQGSTVSSWTTPDGTTYSYDQAGQQFGGGGTRHYGVPGIDSVLNDPAYSSRGLAVA